MSVRRTVVAGALAVAALFGGSVTLLSLDRDGGGVGEGDVPGPAASRPTSAVAPVADAPESDARSQAPAAEASAPAAAQPPDSAGASGVETPPEPALARARSAPLPKFLRKPVKARWTRELEPRVARCLERNGPPGAAPQREAVLRVEMEADAGALRIVRVVDGPLEEQDPASDLLVACAQEVLPGEVIPVRLAKTGKRFVTGFRMGSESATEN